MEPARNKNITSLQPYLIAKVATLINAMEALGYDPVIFEAKRSYTRQLWIYGYGRIHHIGQAKKTWTLKSYHLKGKAVDIISKSRLWDWSAFYKALKIEAEKVGMHTIPQEQCHIQYG